MTVPEGGKDAYRRRGRQPSIERTNCAQGKSRVSDETLPLLDCYKPFYVQADHSHSKHVRLSNSEKKIMLQ